MAASWRYPEWVRRAARRPAGLAAALLAGFALGLGYRAGFDPVAERGIGNFVLSGLHGCGLGLTIWIVQGAFARRPRMPLGRAPRRYPLAVELVLRALVMTAALVAASLALQALLYAGSQGLAWFTGRWFAVDLPRIVALAFALSLAIGVIGEAARLIGAPLLTSLVLGTYLRPTRRHMIVMFLDLAHSTRLAETLGELRVHDLVTRFFLDIDEPIARSGGAVHAYVGDEVIVGWSVADDPALNRRALDCFFAIERTIASLTADYEADFGLVPRFRAGIHAGVVVVSECGDARRQLAYFGDTMNVAARLCDYGKTIPENLVVSAAFLRLVDPGADIIADAPRLVTLRGRQAPLEVIAIRAMGDIRPRAARPEAEAAPPPEES